MAVSDRTYLGMPVRQGTYRAALTAYRVADMPDDSGLPQPKKLEGQRWRGQVTGAVTQERYFVDGREVSPPQRPERTRQPGGPASRQRPLPLAEHHSGHSPARFRARHQPEQDPRNTVTP